MRHAGLEALSTLTDLLSAIRARGPKKPRLGIFYRKGKAWLHFHEDKAGLFADLRVNAEWERFRVSEAEERANLLMLCSNHSHSRSEIPDRGRNNSAPRRII